MQEWKRRGGGGVHVFCHITELRKVPYAVEEGWAIRHSYLIHPTLPKGPFPIPFASAVAEPPCVRL